MDNISAEAKQIAAKGGPLTELADSLAILVDTAVRQQQEIKRLSEQVDALKKRGMRVDSIGTLPEGTNICTHCEAVRRTAPHQKNACYFDPKKMTDQK